MNLEGDVDHFEGLLSDLYQELEYTIDDIINENIPKSQKEELEDYLISIFIKRAKKLISGESNGYMTNSFFNNTINFNNQIQPLNLILPIFPANYTNNTNFGYNPATSYQMLNPNPYLFNYSPYQTQVIQPPQPFFQQQNFVYPIQIAPIPHASKKSTKTKSKKQIKKSHEKKLKKEHIKPKEKKEKSKKTKSSTSKDIEKGTLVIKTFTSNSDFELTGIINYLDSKTSGNIHDKGIIEVTSNSINPFQIDKNHPKNLLNSDPNTCFLSSSSDKKVWICFDFKDMQVEISSYTIKITNKLINPLKNWIIEISNDKNTWETIDKQSRVSGLSSVKSARNFKARPNHFARYVRFTHTIYENQKNGNYAISFDALEFYGKLKITES